METGGLLELHDDEKTVVCADSSTFITILSEDCVDAVTFCCYKRELIAMVIRYDTHLPDQKAQNVPKVKVYEKSHT